jgi:aromatic ring-opening dioxygenase LigB subunit
MGLVAGYMVPHPPIAIHEIGCGEERKIQKTLDAFDEVAEDIARLRPETLVVASPHSVMYRDYFHISPGARESGDFGRFGAGEVRFSVHYDEELTVTVSSAADRSGFPAGTIGERATELDHGTMVPLYFIDRKYTDYCLVRVGLSGLSLESHRVLGEMIRAQADRLGRRWAFIASGDLSHCQKKDGPYGYRPEGPAYDENIMEVMGSGNFLALTDFDEQLLDNCMECGHRSFTIMGGAFAGIEVESRMLSHEATFGVGYGICIYHPLSEEVK